MAKTSAKDIAFQELLTKAVRLRLAKTPYDEIISALGHWNSISACQKAVAGYLKRNQTSAVDESRAEAIALLEDLIFELKAKFKLNKSILIAREIRNLQREISLHQGNYMPTKIVETDAKGNDVPRSITVNVVKSSKILALETPDSPSEIEPGN
jgi:hypothetical protein